MKHACQKIWLIITMFWIVIPSFAYDFEIDKIYYSINSDKETVNVTYSKNSSSTPSMDYVGDIVIPEMVENKGKSYIVAGINQGAFENAKALRSVVFPNSITVLPVYTFYGCSALSNVVLSETLQEIPNNCFLDCGALREILIPKSVKTIGEASFKGCRSLTTMTIPSTVSSIERSAFVECTALSDITFSDSPNSLKIGYGYYDGNNKGAFDDCPLYNIYMGRNISNLYKSGVLSSDEVFSNHKTLSEVVLGPYVTKIHRNLFKNCTALTHVHVEGCNLEDIQDSAFSGCSKLKDISGNAFNNVKTIGVYAFNNCESLNEVCLPQVRTLGRSAFSGTSSSSLENVFIGDYLQVIPESCFSSQSTLKNVYIGAGLVKIENYAFSNCSNLTNIYLFSDNLVSIGEYSIPSTVSKIYVANPTRYDNILKNYYCDFLAIINPISTTYSGGMPSFSFVNNVVGTNMEIASESMNVGVGEYNIPLSVSFSHESWTSTTFISSSYTITPAPLTVIANDASRKYGTKNPELTCSFFGFKNGESKEVLTRLPDIETTADSISKVGVYPIIPFGAEAQNYTFNYERGALTITKADQTIEWEQQFEAVNVGDVIELTATSSAELPIKYTSTNESIAEVFSQGGKKFVEFLNPGTVSIRANQDGNENYAEADRISKRIIVGDSTHDINTLEFEGIIGNVGERVAIGAKVLPADVTDPTISWQSSNPEVAAVDQEGSVWFNAAGSATVTAECQGYEFSVPFVVKEVAANALNVFPVEAVGGVGHEFSLLALHEPDNTTDKSVTWESSDPEVATVSEDGRVSLAAIGSAQITARSGEHSAVCAVTVDETVGLTEMASSGVVIDVVEGGIVVRNAPEGESIAVYAVDGKVVNGAVVEGEETKLNLAAGIYIVKVSPATVGKVLIK